MTEKEFAEIEGRVDAGLIAEAEVTADESLLLNVSRDRLRLTQYVTQLKLRLTRLRVEYDILLDVVRDSDLWHHGYRKGFEDAKRQVHDMLSYCPCDPTGVPVVQRKAIQREISKIEPKEEPCENVEGATKS